MHTSRSALVVAASPGLAMKLCAWLKLSGWHVVAVPSYQAAKARLEGGISLLVTEVELDDYNGLQLALRAQTCHVPTVAIGHHDDVLERDAEQLGSTYLRKEDLSQQGFLVAVEVKLEASRRSAPAFCRDVEFLRRPWSARAAAFPRRMLLH